MNFIIKQIAHLGTTQKNPEETNRRIIITNQIALVLALAATPYALIFYIAGFPKLSLIIVPTVAGLLLCPLFNKLHLYTIAKNLIFAVSCSAILFYSCVFGPAAGVQSLYFSMIGIPIIIYDPKQKTQKTIAILTPILLLLISQQTHYTLFQRILINPIYIQTIVPAKQIPGF